MSARRRLSICYAAPGQNLVPWAGPTRNVLSVAEAMSEWADVTVAFRRIPVQTATTGHRVVAIEPDRPMPAGASDDNAARGLHPLQHLAYCRRLRAFAREQAGAFDVVLEKGWRLSGLLAVAFRQSGVPAVVVENDVRFWTEPLDSLQQIGKYALHGLAHAVAGACCRRASRVIAETDELKAMLMAQRTLAPGQVDVIGLGVDHALFRPAGQEAAREVLGIARDRLVMLYVGAMDEYHDLGPVLEGLGSGGASIELHVVGDGEYRAGYEAAARADGPACRFHGRVPHSAVPQYIAAADLCLAPYRTDAFRGGLVTFSTLKIPEYMACARPVVSVPGAGIARLIADGDTGFLLPNEPGAWRTFLAAPPSRERLAAMGAGAARAVASTTWAGTAAKYLDVCERVLTSSPGSPAAQVADPAGSTR